MNMPQKAVLNSLSMNFFLDRLSTSPIHRFCFLNGKL
jgi:hypothetical protein